MRKSWDHIWMRLAVDIAGRSTCEVPDRKIGCVIVSGDNTKVFSLGYNGGAKGDNNHCEYGGSDAYKFAKNRCTCAHAEMNAIAKLDTSTKDYKKMYVTHSPCDICYKLIVNSYIDEVIYLKLYKEDVVKKLKKLGVKVRKYKR